MRKLCAAVVLISAVLPRTARCDVQADAQAALAEAAPRQTAALAGRMAAGDAAAKWQLSGADVALGDSYLGDAYAAAMAGNWATVVLKAGQAGDKYAAAYDRLLEAAAGVADDPSDLAAATSIMDSYNR